MITRHCSFQVTDVDAARAANCSRDRRPKYRGLAGLIPQRLFVRRRKPDRRRLLSWEQRRGREAPVDNAEWSQMIATATARPARVSFLRKPVVVTTTIPRRLGRGGVQARIDRPDMRHREPSREAISLFARRMACSSAPLPQSGYVGRRRSRCFRLTCASGPHSCRDVGRREPILITVDAFRADSARLARANHFLAHQRSNHARGHLPFTNANLSGAQDQFAGRFIA